MWTKKPFDSHQPRMFRILFVFSIINGIELLVRYLMQYKAMCKFFTSFAPDCNCYCQSNIEGNTKDLFSCQSKHYNSSNPNSIDTSICPYLFQEIGLDQYPVKDLFIKLLDSTFIFILFVLETQLSYQKSSSSGSSSGSIGGSIGSSISDSIETKDTTVASNTNEEKKVGEQKEVLIDASLTDATNINITGTTDATFTSLPLVKQCYPCKSIQRMGTYLLYYNSGKITLLIAALFALCSQDESVISFVVLIVILINLNLSHGSQSQLKPAWYSAWCVYFPVSCILIVLNYIYQFSIFRSDAVGLKITNITTWIGFIHSGGNITPAHVSSYEQMWYLFGMPIVLAMAAALQRYSQTLEQSAIDVDKRYVLEETTFKYIKKMSEEQSEKQSEKQSERQSENTLPQQKLQHKRQRRRQPCLVSARAGLRWYFANHFHYDMTMLSLLVSSFVHLDIRSIFYMLFVLSTIYWGRTKTSRSFTVMYYAVSFLIVYQCVFVTQFPKGTSLQKDWLQILDELNTNTPGLGHWLTFRYQDNTTALFDFFIIFFAILHQRSRRKVHAKTSGATSNVRRNSHLTKFRQAQKRISTLEKDQEIAKYLKEIKAKHYEEDDFTVNTSGCRDWFLILIHEMTVPLLFALFLLIGLLFPEYGLMGLGYIILGANGLRNYSPDPSVNEYTIKNMRPVRLYNWFVLFLTVAYQFPMIPITPSFVQREGTLLTDVNQSVVYNNTCDYNYVTTNCMDNFLDALQWL